ncbi:PEPxxWA-CTERM sorting domain-containing protein [Sandarakinorhabdus limnophila]
MTLQISCVPEPSTWATMMLGFGVVGGAARRRRGLTMAGSA